MTCLTRYSDDGVSKPNSSEVSRCEGCGWRLESGLRERTRRAVSGCLRSSSPLRMMTAMMMIMIMLVD